MWSSLLITWPCIFSLLKLFYHFVYIKLDCIQIFVFSLSHLISAIYSFSVVMIDSTDRKSLYATYNYFLLYVGLLDHTEGSSSMCHCSYVSVLLFGELILAISILQFASLACCRESGYEVPTSCNITCGLKIEGSKNQMENWHKLVDENVEFNAHCPTIDESISTYVGLPFIKDKTVSVIAQLGFLSISSNHIFCKKVGSFPIIN